VCGQAKERPIALAYTAWVAAVAPPALASDRVALIVGATGHRDLAAADEPALRDAVRALLDDIAHGVPNTRVVVLAVLRRGAGLLTAEVALDAGFAVIACIGAPREADEHDLAPADAVRFRAVLDRCAHVVFVPHDDADTGGESATGWYLAFHSHILIALWDGATPRTPGATASIVALRETGLASARSASNAAAPHDPDPMPVFQIVTPRAGTERPADVGAVRRRYPRRFSGDRKAQETFDAALTRLDRFNEDLAATGDEADPPGLPGLMARTDRTANRLQRRALYQLRTLYGISLVAIAAQLGFGDKLGPEPVKIATLAAAFIAYRVARSADLENRYQDYRAVSEGMRVQIAWNAAGAGNEFVDPYYMRMQQSELQWIRMALRSAAFVESLAPHVRDDRIALDWVRQQWRYYHRAAGRDQRSARQYRRIGKVSQYVGLGAVFVVAFLLLPPFRSLPTDMTLSTKHWAASFAALVGAAAALFGSYADKRGYSANAKRYDRMFGVFDRALHQLHRLAGGGPGGQVNVVREVGREALVEQAEWLLARRDRPLRVLGR
jgi:hypothetical protein